MSSSLTLSDLARRRMGDGATIIHVSQPEVPLGRLNAVAVFDDVETARSAIRRVEGLVDGDENLSFVSVARSSASDVPDAGTDPEGVVHDTMSRVIPGALLGAVLGALFVGLLSGLLAGDGVAGVVGAVSGALLFGAIGGLIGAFSRMGDSTAFQETFTVARPDTCLVAVHLADEAAVSSAVDALTAAGGRDPIVVDAAGQVTRPR